MTRKLIIELNEDYNVIETLEEIKKQIEKRKYFWLLSKLGNKRR